MDYTIAKGDCLWNIAKANYNVKSNSEIQEIVNLISKENKIDNPNLIYAGASLVLPETDLFISHETENKEDDYNITEAEYVEAEAIYADETEDKYAEKVDEFEEWNSDENIDKYLSDEEVAEFEIFDAIGEDMSTEEYVKNLTEFSQSYINKYDTNNDGVWSYEEFVSMATAGVEVDKNDNSLAQFYSLLFKTFQMNEDSDTISADEFASQLFMGDMNEEGYVDGKLDFLTYNTYASDPYYEDVFLENVASRKEIYDGVISPYSK